MDDISVEDFQSYHNHQPTAHSCDDSASSPPPMSSLHDSDSNSDPFSSPSPRGHLSSPSNEPIFDAPLHTSSPDTSPQHSGSDDEISVLLSDYHNTSRISSQQHRASSPYTPLKARVSGFRNPASVRAMRDTTPPHYNLASPPLSTSSRQRYFPTPSRNGTPRSHRSHHSPPKLSSPSKKALTSKKEYPLVLLHVTLLPIPTPYSPTVMERVLPPYVLENWKLLREKATPTVLERGILIPHPREDYDLLEERLLESLELRMPRILACGHFHLNDDEEAELNAVAEDERRVQDGEEDEEANDADICPDCGRRTRDGRYGSGTGSRRWDIKLFAANGLMRAGAWGAAWREMERVDVEVCPFVSEELKRDLEMAREHEEAEQDLGDAPIEEDKPAEAIDDARMREIYGDNAQEYIDGLRSCPSPLPTYIPTDQRSAARQQQQQPSHHHSQLPLSTLLRNYVVRLSRDPRNLAIALLVLLLAMAVASRSTLPPTENLAPVAYGPASQSVAIPTTSSGVIQPSSLSTPDQTSNPPLTSSQEKDAQEKDAQEKDTQEMQKTAANEEEEVEESTTTDKVLKAVDGMLDLMGGGEEMAD